MAVELFKETLPHCYQYDIALFEGTTDEYKAVLHTNLTSIPEIDGWVRAFERVTKTNWSVRATYPNLEKLTRKDYVCHLQNWRNRPVKGRKSLSRFKFNGCPADLIVKIKPITKATLFRYKWVRDGLPATITINFKHNHQVTSSESLQFRKLDPAVRKMFAGYFNLGMSASAATKYHQRRIETDPDIGNVAIALEDAARNPKRSTVSYLYSLWRESKLNEPTDSDDEQGAVVAQLYHEQQQQQQQQLQQQRAESDNEQCECQQQQQQQQQQELVGELCSENNDSEFTVSQLNTQQQQPQQHDTDITSTITTTMSTTPKLQETALNATCSGSCVSTTNKRSSSSPTTLLMWRSFSAKIEKRLRQLAPRDSDILDGIAAMDAQLSQLSTYSQLLAFLHSANITLLKQTDNGQEAGSGGSSNGNSASGSGSGSASGSGNTGSNVGTGGRNSSVPCTATVLHTEHRVDFVVPSRHRKHVKQLKSSSGSAVKRHLVAPPTGDGVKRTLILPPDDSRLCDDELVNMSTKPLCCPLNRLDVMSPAGPSTGATTGPTTGAGTGFGTVVGTGSVTPHGLLPSTVGGSQVETSGAPGVVGSRETVGGIQVETSGVVGSRETVGVSGSVLSTHCYTEYRVPSNSTYLQTTNWQYL